jgi:hypothetical protein
MNIEKRIKALQPYVIQMRFSNGVGIVDAVFKEGWKVPTSKVIDAIEGEDKSVNYYMFYTEKEDLGLDDVLDYIEQVINMNVEREKKYELLKVKTEELKDVFRKNPLSKLQTMQFVLGSEKLIPDVMPEEFDDMSIIDEVTVPEVQQPRQEEESIDEIPETTITDSEIQETQVPPRKVGNQVIELPPKGKVELEDYSEVNVVCNCIGDDMCPVCIEEKMAY